jgi:hypothetical protein
MSNAQRRRQYVEAICRDHEVDFARFMYCNKLPTFVFEAQTLADGAYWVLPRQANPQEIFHEHPCCIQNGKQTAFGGWDHILYWMLQCSNVGGSNKQTLLQTIWSSYLPCVPASQNTQILLLQQSLLCVCMQLVL